MLYAPDFLKKMLDVTDKYLNNNQYIFNNISGNLTIKTSVKHVTDIIKY